MKFEFISKQLQQKYVVDLDCERIQIFQENKKVYNTKDNLSLQQIIDVMKHYEEKK